MQIFLSVIAVSTNNHFFFNFQYLTEIVENDKGVMELQQNQWTVTRKVEMFSLSNAAMIVTFPHHQQQNEGVPVEIKSWIIHLT